MVRPFEDGLAMHQLRYPDEVKSWSEVPVGKLPKAAPAELALASQIIAQLQHDTFDPTQYSDEVKDRVRKLIAKKAKGGEIVAPPEAPKPVVTDLMEALKASLAGEKKAPAEHVHAGRSAKGNAARANSRRGHQSHGKRAVSGHSSRAHSASKTKRAAGAHSTRTRAAKGHAKRAHH